MSSLGGINFEYDLIKGETMADAKLEKVLSKVTTNDKLVGINKMGPITKIKKGTTPKRVEILASKPEQKIA